MQLLPSRRSLFLHSLKRRRGLWFTLMNRTPKKWHYVICEPQETLKASTLAHLKCYFPENKPKPSREAMWYKTRNQNWWVWLSLITKVIGVSLDETSERTPSWTQTRLPIHRMWGGNNNKKGYSFWPRSLGWICYVAIDHRYHRWNPPRYKEIIHHDKVRCTPRIQGWFRMRKIFKCNLPPEHIKGEKTQPPQEKQKSIG